MAYKGCSGALALALLLTLAGVSAAEEADTWKPIGDSDGVQVWRMDVPGQSMPGFRGEALIRGPAEAVLAEVVDVASHTDWMYRCAEARRIERLDDASTIAYNRTDSPWPAADRDVVVKTRVVREDDGRILRMTFRNVPSDQVPPQEGVVRMPRLEGAYTMTAEGPDLTRVSYQVEADIGGRIPDWLATLVARDLPVKTLSRLRERVESKVAVASTQ